MNSSVLVITFLTCALLAITEGVPVLQLRCQCTRTVSKKIPEHNILNIEIHPAGPHCKDEEVIATVKLLKEFQICLNPDSNWVQNILKKRNLTP